jgi:N-acetyl sugar amidotransferase
MDTTDPEIVFDNQGVCNHCKFAGNLLRSKPFVLPPDKKKTALDSLVKQIKNDGKGKRYNCIIGLSGGVDSSYVAYVVKELGLAPLAVHLDNGWDTELSVQNIENICKKLDIDLFTYVIDWEEFKDIQLSFLKASTPDSEIPSDHAIVSILYKMALKEGVKYIIGGTNITSESILPKAWSQGHADWKYIKNIQKRFGSKPIISFPHRSFCAILYYRWIRRIKWIELLNYLDYDKEKAKTVIAKELGWRNYGHKHAESNYTRFFQEFILPTKFGFDKRKAHLSSLICAGQLKRADALEQLKEPLYESAHALEQDIAYVINKFGLTREAFNAIMTAPPRSYFDYPNSDDYFKLLQAIKRILWRKPL